MSTFTDLDEERILQTAKWIKNTNKPMAVHAEDKKMIIDRTAISKSAGQNDWQAYCATRDDQAEANAIKLLVKIAEKTGCQIHVVHLSSKLGLDHNQRSSIQRIKSNF